MLNIDTMWAYVVVVLLLIIFIYSKKNEQFTVEERIAILEKRVDDLYSGGADARHLPVFSSSNQN
jgi:cell division protein FtsL